MTERQKQIYNLGLDHAARLHEDAAIQYERYNLITDVSIHKQWASNIRREYKRTDRPYSEYVKEA